MEQRNDNNKRVLFVYYSLSHQTKNLLHAMSNGFAAEKVDVVFERLRPLRPIGFPFGSIGRTVYMMVITFLRFRMPIETLASIAFEKYDLIVVAGPTWSYNPSGPVLAMFDRDGKKLFKGKPVIALISCRGYWRVHWFGLRRLLRKCGATVLGHIIFTHPSPEPWRTIGVFCKLAGMVPERMGWLRPYYPKYGHTLHQMHEAHRFGAQLAGALKQGEDLSHLNFSTKAAIP